MSDGWYCDDQSEGCVHDSVVNKTDDGSSTLNNPCTVSTVVSRKLYSLFIFGRKKGYARVAYF